jgi:GH15 family glucan-1,4-alpha-glucosidase
MALPIEDYAIIGDTQTAALVGKNGSIDWLCFPRFDSGAVFAALLGTDQHGRWLLGPAADVRAVRRRYRGDTLVLETEFDTDDGTVRVIDFMPPRGEAPDVVRIVEGVRGRVPMRMELRLRFDYGHVVPWVYREQEALVAVAGPDAVWLRTPVPIEGRDLATCADFSIGAGDRAPFVLTWRESHLPPPKPVDPVVEMGATEGYWQGWMSACTYDGEWRDAVVRSLLTLKALTYAPTGGIVAAATTSLPEQLGGVRNWDYRFCWLRDATITLQSLLYSGFQSEAQDWRKWLLRAIAGDPAEMQIMYGVAGERRLTEYVANWLPGYDGNPVRIGNAAAGQFQLDVYGELLGVAWAAVTQIGRFPRQRWNQLRKLMDYLETVWREPDDGMWESRGPRRHYTSSKLMAWVAFDRAVALADQFELPAPRDRWALIRDEIKAEILERAYDPDRNTFTQYYGSRSLDAGTLAIGLVGLIPPTDPRMTGTIDAVRSELGKDGLIARYSTDETDDGLEGSEGQFLACSFWLVDALCLNGRRDEARELFERLLALGNDLGLFAEEYDVARGRQVGNFPQAFTHLALINAARILSATPQQAASVLGRPGIAPPPPPVPS